MNIAQELIDIALAGRGHKQVPEISGLPEYFTAKKVLKSVTKIAQAFECAQHIVFREYCKELKYTQPSNELPVAYSKFKECENYYQVEIQMILDAMRNYEEFFKNNWIRVLFLGVRLDDE